MSDLEKSLLREDTSKGLMRRQNKGEQDKNIFPLGNSGTVYCVLPRAYSSNRDR